MPEFARVALVALLLLAGDAAEAMGVRKDSTLLARSGDGAALYEVREHGPEGGGALTYRIEGKGRSAAGNSWCRPTSAPATAAGRSGSRRRRASSASPP